jgi:hypothetical protein
MLQLGATEKNQPIKPSKDSTDPTDERNKFAAAQALF